MNIPTKTEWDALRSRVEAAEAALNRMRGQAEAAGAELYANRMQWRDTLDMLETRWSERDAQREAAHRQEMDSFLSELTGWRERAKEAEAERDRLRGERGRLRAALQRIADATEPPSLDPYKDRCIHRRSMDQDCVHCTRAFARAALSGGGDDEQVSK